MSKKVFHIDQECYVIFIDELISKQDKFIRIGNSEALQYFDESLQCIDLLSKIYPGDLFKEIQIFQQNPANKVIGLKNLVDNFKNFLTNNQVSLNQTEFILAEEEKIFRKKKSETDFLKDIANNERLKNDSFASFYNDGNIRIFNRSEFIFDLKEALSQITDEIKEIRQIADFFLKFYKDSYKKTGLIQSNKSLFIFSENNFVCLTDSTYWYKDALRVGINPIQIDYLVLSENVVPDSTWFKIFLAKPEEKKKVKIIFTGESAPWQKLFPNDVFSFIDLNEEPLDFSIGQYKLSTENDQLKISTHSFNLLLFIKKNFLKNGQIFNGNYTINGREYPFKLIIEKIENYGFTLYNYNPLIINETLDKSDYIAKFWKKLSDKLTADLQNDILKKDTDYPINYPPPVPSQPNFYTKLFTETIRRVVIEGNKNVDDNLFSQYKSALTDFNGKLINANSLLIEQTLGFNSKSEQIIMRDHLTTNEFVNLDDDANPFTKLEKEQSREEWKLQHDQFREKYKKNISNNKVSEQITDRFTTIEKNKKLYLEEQDKLKRFIENLRIDESREQKYGVQEKYKNTEKTVSKDETGTSSSSNDTNTILAPGKKSVNSDLTTEKTQTDKTGKAEKVKKPRKILTRVFMILIIILLFALLCGSLYYFIPPINRQINSWLVQLHFMKPQDIKDLTQKEWENLRKSQDNNNGSNKQSNFYKFYMTQLDLLNLTNLVAEKNNYHRIVYDFQKKNVTGKDPDWIWPGIVLELPDASKITVKPKDSMWKICEEFLINQINNDEIKIRDAIKKTKTNEMSINEAKAVFKEIKENSYSEMLRDFMEILISLNSYENWEPYLKEKGLD